MLKKTIEFNKKANIHTTRGSRLMVDRMPYFNKIENDLTVYTVENKNRRMSVAEYKGKKFLKEYICDMGGTEVIVSRGISFDHSQLKLKYTTHINVTLSDDSNLFMLRANSYYNMIDYGYTNNETGLRVRVVAKGNKKIITIEYGGGFATKYRDSIEMIDEKMYYIVRDVNGRKLHRVIMKNMKKIQTMCFLNDIPLWYVTDETIKTVDDILKKIKHISIYFKHK